MIKKETIRDCFNLLEAEYGKQINQKRELWGQKFKRYTDKQLIEAVGEFIDKGKYFPRISDIKEIIEGSPEEEAILAWLYFKGKLEDEGSYMSVSFPEYPAIADVIEALGGWVRIGETDIEEEKWLKIEFIKYYKIMKKRREHIKELPGIFEIENNNKGYTEKVMIERYGRKLDGRKIDRKLIEEIKGRENNIGISCEQSIDKKEPMKIGDIIDKIKKEIKDE